MTEREEIARIIAPRTWKQADKRCDDPNFVGKWTLSSLKSADALIAAGYKKESK